LKNLENVNVILEVLYLSKYQQNQEYLSTNHIIVKTGIPESTVKGVLKNLVKKSWVEKRLLFPVLNGYPESRDDMPQKFILKINNKNKVFWVPKDRISEFKKRLFSLTKSKKIKEFDGSVNPGTLTYKEKLDEHGKRKNEFSVVFKGKTKLVKSQLDEWYDTKPIFFFKILVFPYIIDKRNEGHTKLSMKEIIDKQWFDVPKRHEEFWKEAAEKVREIRNNLK